MDELKAQMALLGIYADYACMSVLDMLIVSLLSDDSVVAKWALDSLKLWGELRIKQMGEGTLKASRDLTMEFLQSLNDSKKIVIGFSLN